MDLPFTKLVVDSRHAASGDASNFDITLPESLTLPPNAVSYTTDMAIAHLLPQLRWPAKWREEWSVLQASRRGCALCPHCTRQSLRTTAR